MDRKNKEELTKALTLVVMEELLGVKPQDTTLFVIIAVDREGRPALTAGCPDLPMEEQTALIRSCLTDVAAGLNAESLHGRDHWREWQASE